MIVSAFRRSLRVWALALCAAALAVSASPASARSHHGYARHAHAHHAGHHLRHYAYHRHHGHIRQSRRERAAAHVQARDAAEASQGAAADTSSSSSSGLVAEARRYLGGNPTGRASLWCARFMNMVLQHTGYRGTGSDMASSFAGYGQRVSGPQVGAIAVMGRRGGGHVGIITGIDAKGNPIMISGNYGRRVAEAPVSRGRIYAYVMPTS